MEERVSCLRKKQEYSYNEFQCFYKKNLPSFQAARVFANVTGSARFFGDVTSSVFGDVTSVVKEIFFGDVTANQRNPLRYAL